MTFGKRLAELRKKRGFSQDDLAKLLNMNRANISNYEREKITNVPSEVVAKLAELFNVTTDYLLCKTDVNLYDYAPSDDEKLQKKENPDSYKNEKEFLKNIDLSDEELRKQFKVVVDGRELTEKEWKKLIAFLRVERDYE
ncbi:hypothetical protein C2W64_04034 [Brevibacillus laterosporus]|nr:helix-turn-helix transcriptional regulator [Brevibacillus laterosporus]RAP29087.1 hypothetical protein C2W64_04034 [Brevibacillus laterosporus]